MLCVHTGNGARFDFARCALQCLLLQVADTCYICCAIVPSFSFFEILFFVVVSSWFAGDLVFVNSLVFVDCLEFAVIKVSQGHRHQMVHAFTSYCYCVQVGMELKI